MSLDDLRTRIDTIDDEILALLSRRADVVAEIADEKRASGAPTFDPERERQVLDRLAARGAGAFPREAVRAVYREVMSASLALQEPVRVAFLGPPGTFTHMAAREAFGLAVRYLESATIEGAVDAVERREAAYAVVPFENSTEGPVTQASDALLESSVRIRGEIVLPIEHCLASLAGGLSSVARVHSHPQALAQCRGFLAKHVGKAALVPSSSTSAAMLEAAADAQVAAIGSRLAADLHGLPVVRDRIQDRSDNATRFAVLGLEDAKRTGRDRTALAFSLRDEAGALARVLELFASEGVSLSRIESRPGKQRAWDYVFLVEVLGHREDDDVARALSAVEARCPMVRVLGSYPRHEQLAAAAG